MEKETLTRILYYGDLSPDSKQFIQNLVDKKDKEIERLNNIINELEKYLKEVMESYGYENDITDRIEKMAVKNILNKLKELKNK